MTTKPVRTHATIEELLSSLADVEEELWTHGGRHCQQRRRDLLAAAFAAGCSFEAIARALNTSPNDVQAWVPA